MLVFKTGIISIVVTSDLQSPIAGALLPTHGGLLIIRLPLWNPNWKLYLRKLLKLTIKLNYRLKYCIFNYKSPMIDLLLDPCVTTDELS